MAFRYLGGPWPAAVFLRQKMSFAGHPL